MSVSERERAKPIQRERRMTIIAAGYDIRDKSTVRSVLCH